MAKTELAKRYFIFFCGMMGVAFGIAFVTKADLGTSPISSIPYTLSLILPALTLGNWTILFNLMLVFVQKAILKDKLKRVDMILQVVVTFVFGYCIDFAMFLLQWLEPEVYIVNIIVLLIGCAILALGAYLQVLGGVVMLPGDGFSLALTHLTHKEFGSMRFASDMVMVAVAAVLCLVFLHELVGVREGTIISVLLIGNIVKVYTRWFRPLAERFLQGSGRS